MSNPIEVNTASEAIQAAMDLAERAGVVESDSGPEEQTEIQIDPQLLAQATQMRNARLIAMMVHENAMLEVALEQERRDKFEWKAKHDAIKSAFNA